jgi:hypothetical protein
MEWILAVVLVTFILSFDDLGSDEEAPASTTICILAKCDVTMEMEKEDG